MRCECGAVVYEHERGDDPDCEYHEHHCDTCHSRGRCTLDECVSEQRLINSGALPANDPRMRLRREVR